MDFHLCSLSASMILQPPPCCMESFAYRNFQVLALSPRLHLFPATLVADVPLLSIQGGHTFNNDFAFRNRQVDPDMKEIAFLMVTRRRLDQHTTTCNRAVEAFEFSSARSDHFFNLFC
jgi:hypothetical protein